MQQTYHNKRGGCCSTTYAE